jgi:TPR repeat protein
VDRSFEEAAKWWKKAAEQGDATSQHNIGVAYYDGNGVVKSFEEAVRWYTKAAEQGFSIAQYKLGAAYYYGYGVVQNFQEANKWLELAAGQGHAPARELIAGSCKKSFVAALLCATCNRFVFNTSFAFDFL